MDIDTIFSMIERAEKSSFNKLVIETKDIKLCLERTVETAAQAPAVTKKETIHTETEQSADDFVVAPISGVFYVAKEPGADPFVKPGTKVNKGDVLCIIEAMKTMNEIMAPKAGVIESVLKEDAETIAAKEALFKYTR